MQALVRISAQLRRWGHAFGPYLLLEMVLPGGTFFAFLLYLYRRRVALPAAAAGINGR
ncbi:MAG: hypothetical protein ACXWHZ_15655 [Usitatibacter sp.]